MDIKQYYDDIRREKTRLSRELLAGKHAAQPEPELVADEYGDSEKQPTSVYMTSVRNRERNTSAGHVCLATLEMAATRIVEGTHRVASAEEIEAYLKRQQEQKRYHEETDLRFDSRARQFRVQLPTE
jgi:hypothetical protein